MQCGIPVLRIECPEAGKYLPVHRIINQYGKFVYIIKQILTIQGRAIIYDSSVCGYEHPGSNSFNNTITERKIE